MPKKYFFPIFITISLDFIGVGVVLPILAPLLLDNNGILPFYTLPQRTIILGFLISSFSIASFFGGPFIGAWSDNIGRKKVLRVTLVISFISYLLMALGIFLQDIILLFLARIIGGFAGSNVNTCVAAMVDITDPKERVKNFGLIGFSSFAFGYVVGPLIGGILSNPKLSPLFNNQTPFWFIAFWILVNLLIVETYFKETLKTYRQEKLTLLSGIRNLNKLWDLPKLRAVFLIAFLVTLGFNFFDQFFQVFLIQKFNFTSPQIANMLALLGVSMAFTQGFLVRMIPKNVKPETILFLCLPLVAFLMPLLLIPTNHIYFYLVIPLIAIAQGLVWPYSSTLLSNQVDDNEQGEVLGINTSLTALAIGLPPLISGFLAALNFQLPILFAGLTALIAWLIFIWSYRGFVFSRLYIIRKN